MCHLGHDVVWSTASKFERLSANLQFAVFLALPLFETRFLDAFRSYKEPRHEKIWSLGFPTRSDMNRAVQPQKMARGIVPSV